MASKLPRVGAALDKSMDALVLKTAHRIRNKAIELILRGSKSGRTYGRHQASAPGEAPASETGRLVQSIQVKHRPGSMKATVSAGTGYARKLEFGTSIMAPRPFMRPAAAAIRQQGIAKGFKLTIAGD